MALTRPAEHYDDDAPPARRARTDDGSRSKSARTSTQHRQVSKTAFPPTTTPAAHSHHRSRHAVSPPGGTEGRPASTLRDSGRQTNVPSRQAGTQQPKTPPRQRKPSLSAPGSQSQTQPSPGQVLVLAEAQADTPCTLRAGPGPQAAKPEPVTLRLRVQVHTCPVPFSTRLGYHGTIILRRAGHRDRDIGSITAWRVSRPTRAQPDVDRLPFLRDWIRSRLDGGPHEDGGGHAWTELAMAMRGLYTPRAGQARSQLGEDVRRVLADGGNELVFIQLLHVLWQDDDGLMVSLVFWF